jgi:hypothetical protein
LLNSVTGHSSDSSHKASSSLSLLNTEYAEVVFSEFTEDVSVSYQKTYPVSSVLGRPDWFICTGYDESLRILQELEPPPNPLVGNAYQIHSTRKKLEEYGFAIEQIFAETRPCLRESINSLVMKKLSQLPIGELFDLTEAITQLIREINAAWMGCSRKIVDYHYELSYKSFYSGKTDHLHSEWKKLGDELMNCTLFSRLNGKGILNYDDLPFFLSETANRMYQLPSFLGIALSLLGRSSTQLHSSHEIASKIPGFLMESARLLPFWNSFRRYCTTPLSIGGVTIPSGGTVDVFVGAANRDSHRFSDPDMVITNRNSPPPIIFDSTMGSFLRLSDNMPWQQGNLLMDVATIVLSGLFSFFDSFNIYKTADMRVVLQPDCSTLRLPSVILSLGDRNNAC